MIRSAAFWLLLLVSACQRVVDGPPEDESDAEARGHVQRYVFGTTQGEEVSAESMRGRVTALLFVTTFDLASQLAAKQLNQALHTHTPRINVAAIVLEAPKYAPLADVFRTSLKLSYPVAIADLAMLSQSSTLGGVHSVPTLIILDKEGREVSRNYGAFSDEDLDRWLTRAR
ncbi:MAG TPA: TlpA family protein disulfide reductase [Polyangiaceae bacterium]|nr:TlpA family protein disulfide reductase [Polyangiaceae bacterium]